MRQRTRHRVAAMTAVLLVVAAAAAVGLVRRGDDSAAKAKAAVAAFAAAWSRGDDAGAGRLAHSPAAGAPPRAHPAGLRGPKGPGPPRAPHLGKGRGPG